METRASFIGILRGCGIDLAESLHFRTQVTGDDATRPDLVGKDQAGREVLLIEAKFWAGLTENQPVSYLERLTTDTNWATHNTEVADVWMSYSFWIGFRRSP